MKIRLLAVVYIIILVAIIFIADAEQYKHLLQPIRGIPYGDKISHFLLMGLLSFLVNLSFSCSRVKISGVYFLKGSLIVAVIVTIEEFSQLFFKYRTFDLIDLASDYLGIFLFGRIACLVQRRRVISSDKTL
jgi:VanZ family protein